MSMLTMSYDFRMLRQLHRAQILWSISVPYEHFICIRNGFSDSVRLLDQDCFIMPKTHCPHSAQDIHTFYHWLRDHSEPIRCVWYNRLTNQIGTEPVGGCGNQIWTSLSIQLTSNRGFSVIDQYIKFYAYLCYLFSLDYLSLQQLTFLTVCLSHSVNFPCRTENTTERPEKTHDFRQNVDYQLFLHESIARIALTHHLRGERHLLWRLLHQRPKTFAELSDHDKIDYVPTS